MAVGSAFVPNFVGAAEAHDPNGAPPAVRVVAELPPKPQHAWSSLDRVEGSEAARDSLAAGALSFKDASLQEVLDFYQRLSGRTIIRSGTVGDARPPMPGMGMSGMGSPGGEPKLTLRNETPLTRPEALQMLDTALAENGIVMVISGDKAIKAVPLSKANLEAAPLTRLPREQLPDSSTLITYLVELKNRQVSEVMPALQPFSALPNSLVAMSGPGLLVLRDYSSNVRRMLEMLERIEQSPLPPPNEPTPGAPRRGRSPLQPMPMSPGSPFPSTMPPGSPVPSPMSPGAAIPSAMPPGSPVPSPAPPPRAPQPE